LYGATIGYNISIAPIAAISIIQPLSLNDLIFRVIILGLLAAYEDGK